MTVVEKNDVDIAKLFQWSKETVITGRKGKKIKVFLRLIGDAELNRARTMALRDSAVLRRSLRTEGSDDNLAYIPFPEELPHENLVESILLYTMRDTTKEVIKSVSIPVPKIPPSDASTEKLEKYQEEVDKYPALRVKTIEEEMEKRVQKRRDELTALDDKALYKIYVDSIVNEMCEQELIRKFKEYTVFFGTFADKKLTRRFFPSLDEFNNLPRDLKSELIDEYSLLDVETEELKK